MLLSRGAEELDAQPRGVRHRQQTQRRADAGGRDDVVAARVADAGKGVGAQGDGERAGAVDRLETGRHPVGSAGDLEARILEEGRDPRGGLVLLPRQLGVLVDRIIADRAVVLRIAKQMGRAVGPDTRAVGLAGDDADGDADR